MDKLDGLLAHDEALDGVGRGGLVEVGRDDDREVLRGHLRDGAVRGDAQQQVEQPVEQRAADGVERVERRDTRANIGAVDDARLGQRVQQRLRQLAVPDLDQRRQVVHVLWQAVHAPQNTSWASNGGACAVAVSASCRSCGAVTMTISISISISIAVIAGGTV